MRQYKTLTFLADEYGDVLRSCRTGEPMYYAMEWDELVEEANKVLVREGKPEIGDVRLANYAMDVLGIPNQYSEAEIEEHGEWFVYWR